MRSLAKDYERASSTFNANALRYEDDWLWQSEMVSDGPYRYGVISVLWSRLTTAGEEIEQAAAELDVRERAVSEYLRDYFNAEVSTVQSGRSAGCAPPYSRCAFGRADRTADATAPSCYEGHTAPIESELGHACINVQFGLSQP